jgi:hypothetical protein
MAEEAIKAMDASDPQFEPALGTYLPGSLRGDGARDGPALPHTSPCNSPTGLTGSRGGDTYLR